MATTLETLIKLAEFEVDERRRALKEVQEKEDTLLAQIKDLAARVEKEKQAAAQSTEAGFAYGQFVNWSVLERERLEKAVADLQPELEEARANLSEAFAEQKKVEITKERREEEEREELKAKEQAFIDDFTISQYNRRDPDDN